MDLVSSLARVREAVSGFDPAALPADDCVTIVEELARTEKARAAARARTAARVADAGAHRGTGFADPVDWLARLTGTSTGQAERDLALAGRLEELPATRDAVVRGALSIGQAEEIAKTEKHCPGSEREMLATATRESLRSLKDTGRKKRAAAVDPATLLDRQREVRSIRHWRDELGMVCGVFALTPEVGVPFVNRLDAETDREWEKAWRDHRPEPRERHAADAFATMVNGGGKRHATRADVVFVCDVATGESHVVGGGPVPASTVLDFIDRGAFIKGVLHDGVDITTVKHYGKNPLAVLQTAFELGKPPDFDGVCCSIEGCDRRYHCERDHLDPRANGGAWSVNNIDWKCPQHHDEKTDQDRKAGLLGPRAKSRGSPP